MNKINFCRRTPKPETQQARAPLTEVYNLGGGWRAILDGKPIGAFFNSKGAALAGIDVERRRRLAQS